MFSYIFNLNLVSFSALEQFEILTYRGPEYGVFSWLFTFFVPKQLFTNFSFSFFLVFFYLISLCDLKSYLPKTYNLSPLVNEDLKTSLSEDILFSNSEEFELVLEEGESIVYFDYFDMSTEASFVIYTFTDFVYNQMLENLIYFKSIFLNYTLSLFLFLLACNLFGMIPYSLTVTSYLILTLNLSGMSFFANLILALRVHGLKFFKFFVPTGVTGPLVILMVLIELISYVARLFSMAIRLFANMLSGHALMKILSGLVFLSFSDIYFFGIVSILFNTILIVVTALEVIVAALQSYVFVVLSVVYTNEAIVLH